MVIPCQYLPSLFREPCGIAYCGWSIRQGECQPCLTRLSLESSADLVELQASGIFDSEPYRTYVINFATNKLYPNWGQIFVKGIACNFVSCRKEEADGRADCPRL